MKLSEKEESSMVSWNLMPHRSNEKWWRNYRDCRARGGDFQNWDSVLKESYGNEEYMDKY